MQLNRRGNSGSAGALICAFLFAFAVWTAYSVTSGQTIRTTGSQAKPAVSTQQGLDFIACGTVAGGLDAVMGCVEDLFA